MIDDRKSTEKSKGSSNSVKKDDQPEQLTIAENQSVTRDGPVYRQCVPKLWKATKPRRVETCFRVQPAHAPVSNDENLRPGLPLLSKLLR
jgi:hypothetical protein